ncbi:MAG: hypothetical protein HY703_02675 [Gemmatimonadetes bacterium]|nr:hypothetical protein [Gemmatimonadota bacterium]
MRRSMILLLLAAAACTEHEPSAYEPPTAADFAGNYLLLRFAGLSTAELADVLGANESFIGKCLHGNLKLSARGENDGVADMGFHVTVRTATGCAIPTPEALFLTLKGRFRSIGENIALSLDSAGAPGALEPNFEEVAGQGSKTKEGKFQLVLNLIDLWAFSPKADASGGKVSTGVSSVVAGRGKELAGQIIYQK